MPSRGEDARLYARRALDYGDQSSAGLTAAADAYGRLADALAHPPDPAP